MLQSLHVELVAKLCSRQSAVDHLQTSPASHQIGHTVAYIKQTHYSTLLLLQLKT